jgi:hypothetical protein
MAKQTAQTETEFYSSHTAHDIGKSLIDPSSSPQQLKSEANILIATQQPSSIELGKKYLLLAADKFLETGDVQEAFLCKKQLQELVVSNGDSPICNIYSKNPVYLQNLDGGDLKTGDIRVHNRVVDDEPSKNLTFKVNHPARERLESHLQAITTNLDAFKETVCDGMCSDVIVSTVNDQYLVREGDSFSSKNAMVMESGGCLEIDFVGLGKIRIGKNPNIASSYNRLEIELSSNVRPEEVESVTQKMLYAVGLKIDLQESQPQNIERRQIMTIFHTYYPRESYVIECEQETYSLPPEVLKEKICTMQPEMRKIFAHYEQNPHLIGTQEISPGKSAIALLDIPEKVREAGGVGLFLSIKNPESAISAIKTGPLSTQERYEQGLIISGASSGADYRTGGAESVFTRIVTESDIISAKKTGDYSLYGGKIILLMDLDLLARGGYAYTEDHFGEKSHNYNIYGNRSNLWEFTELAGKTFCSDNEVMIKSHVPPSYIRGVIVPDDRTKSMLTMGLKYEGIRAINGKPLTETIHVASTFTKEMWNAERTLY